MKETIKASIGGYAFNFDLDAYQILNSYLENLKYHFKTKNDGLEILEDIQARMSELLLLKTESFRNNVSSADANDIIKIMGNPLDFDEDYNTETSQHNIETDIDREQIPTFQKKIYRDKSNSIMGGVFCGLGQYFRIDPVLIRIAYIAIIIISHYFSDRLADTLFILYFIFWAIMPKAKTINQKIAMSGIDPSIEAIENRSSTRNKKLRGQETVKIIGKTLKYFIGVILIFVSICFIVSIPLALAFPNIPVEMNINDLDILNTILINRQSTILPVFILLIPALILLYIGIKLLLRFTIKDVTIICIAAVIWVSIGITLLVKNPQLVVLYQNHETTIEEMISDY